MLVLHTQLRKVHIKRGSSQKCFFKLRRASTIYGRSCPVVWPVVHIPLASQVNHLQCRTAVSQRKLDSEERWAHGLDGKDHAGLHDSYGLVLRVVWNIRWTVEHLVHAMSRVSPHRCTALFVGYWLTVVRYFVVRFRCTRGGEPKQAYIDATYITFPMSLKRAPGLQILIASSRHFLVTRISLSESLSMAPTG